LPAATDPSPIHRRSPPPPPPPPLPLRSPFGGPEGAEGAPSPKGGPLSRGLSRQRSPAPKGPCRRSAFARHYRRNCVCILFTRPTEMFYFGRLWRTRVRSFLRGERCGGRGRTPGAAAAFVVIYAPRGPRQAFLTSPSLLRLPYLFCLPFGAKGPKGRRLKPKPPAKAKDSGFGPRKPPAGFRGLGPKLKGVPFRREGKAPGWPKTSLKQV